MFSESDFRVWSLMTIGTAIIIVNDISFEPMFIIELVDSVSCVGSVADVEVRRWNNVLVCVDHCHVDNFCGYT